MFTIFTRKHDTKFSQYNFKKLTIKWNFTMSSGAKLARRPQDGISIYFAVTFWSFF